MTSWALQETRAPDAPPQPLMGGSAQHAGRTRHSAQPRNANEKVATTLRPAIEGGELAALQQCLPKHGAARHRPAAGSRTGGNQPGQASHRHRWDDSQLAAKFSTDGVEPSRAAAASTSPMTGASLKRFSP